MVMGFFSRVSRSTDQNQSNQPNTQPLDCGGASVDRSTEQSRAAYQAKRLDPLEKGVNGLQRISSPQQVPLDTLGRSIRHSSSPQIEPASRPQQTSVVTYTSAGPRTSQEPPANATTIPPVSPSPPIQIPPPSPPQTSIPAAQQATSPNTPVQAPTTQAQATAQPHGQTQTPAASPQSQSQSQSQIAAPSAAPVSAGLEKEVADLKKMLADTQRQLAEHQRASQLRELGNDIKDKTAPGKKPPTKDQIAFAVKLLDPDETAMPTADQVISRVAQIEQINRSQAIATSLASAAKIDAQFNARPKDGSIAELKKWSDATLAFREKLPQKEQQQFDKKITLAYNRSRPGGEESYKDEPITPRDFFTKVLVGSAIKKIEDVPKHDQMIDGTKLGHEMREFGVLEPETLNLMKDHPSVLQARRVLGSEFHDEFDSRLAGKPVEAETHVLRRLITSGDINTEEGRKEAKAALAVAPTEIDTIYRKKFGISIKDDVKKANSSLIQAAEKAEKEEKEAQAKAIKAAQIAKEARKLIGDFE